MTTPSDASPAKCRLCGRLRPPAELLEVRDRLIGDTFLVCRPGLEEARGGQCFRSAVGPADRFEIALAAEALP
jgi:hypothetical protein